MLAARRDFICQCQPAWRLAAPGVAIADVAARYLATLDRPIVVGNHFFGHGLWRCIGFALARQFPMAMTAFGNPEHSLVPVDRFPDAVAQEDGLNRIGLLTH